MRKSKLALVLSVILLFTACFSLVGCKSNEITLTVDRSITYEMDKPYQGAWYTMFVYSFADSNGDGIGDLRGLIDKLDYLNDGDPTTDTDLGITGMWLLPIMPAHTFHKYDIEDYYDIDPQYGTMADFDELIAECNKRGIAVVIDLVLNCTSNIHPWFLEALNDPTSPYREYYRFYDDLDTEAQADVNLHSSVLGYDSWYRYDLEGNSYDVDGTVGDQIACSLYAGYMPDLNYDNEATREEVQRIAKFWLDKGCAGFRLDSAPHIYSAAEIPMSSNKTVDEYNYEFWSWFYDYCKSINPDVYLVGEVLTGVVNKRAEYMRSIRSDFDWGLIYYLRDEYKNPSSNNTVGLLLASEYKTFNEYTGGDYINAPFQTDADTNRMSGVFDNNPQKIKQAQMFSLTIEGLPFMYYGDELGMLGNKSSGEIFKLSFPWGEGDPYQTTKLNYWNIYGKKKDLSDYTEPFDSQMTNPTSVLSAIRTLIHIRTENEALYKGKYTSFTAAENITSYKMVSEHQECLILHNMFDHEVSFELDLTGWTLLYITDENTVTSVEGVVTLDAYQSIILCINK